MLSEAQRILGHERAVFLKGRGKGSHKVYYYEGELIVFAVHGKHLHKAVTKKLIETLKLREKYGDIYDGKGEQDEENH